MKGGKIKGEITLNFDAIFLKVWHVPWICILRDFHVNIMLIMITYYLKFLSIF